MSATQTPPMEAPRDAQVTPMNRDAGGERPNIVTTMVRLRWSLMFAAMRKSPWQVVGYVLALLMALGIVVGAGLAAFALTGGAVEWNEAAFAVLRVVMVNAGTVGIIFAALIQLLLIGESSTMSAQKFSLFGIGDRTLTAGLYLSAFTGLPATCAFLSLLCASRLYVGYGTGAVLGGVLSAALTVMVAMCFSKAALSLASQLTRTERGKNTLYILVTLLVVVAAQLPNIYVNTHTEEDFSAIDVNGLVRLTDVVGWLPFGWSLGLPFDAARGNAAACIARVALALVFCALCFAALVWCIRRERLQGEPQSNVRRERSIGAFNWMPDSASGAISARLFISLKRDPRQAMQYVLPVLFIVIFALQSHGESMVVWQCFLWMGLMMLIGESNGIAYDGRAYAMEQIAGVPGRVDRWGRTRVYLAYLAIFYVLCALLTYALTGDWRTPAGVMRGITCTVVGFGVVLISLGSAEFFSTFLMYPVPSIRKPFSSPQGRAMAQGLFPFAFMLATCVMALPTGIVAIVLAATGHWGMNWVLMPVSLANGVLFLWLGVWLGGKILDARGLKVLATLDNFASLQQ